MNKETGAILILLLAMQTNGAMAEPYAEWGYWGFKTMEKETTVLEKAPYMAMPAKEMVGVGLLEGSVAAFVLPVISDKSCAIGLRSEKTLEEACSFYTQELEELGRVFEVSKQPGLCEYSDQEAREQVVFLTVQSISGDDAYSINGSTEVVIQFEAKGSYRCGL